MPDIKFLPIHQYDTSTLPLAMQNALDAAVAVCKRLGHTCIGLPHLMLGILRNCPSLVATKVSEIDREQVEKSLLKSLEEHGQEFNQDLTHVSMPETLDRIIRRVFRASGSDGGKADFLTEVESQLPGQVDHWLKLSEPVTAPDAANPQRSAPSTASTPQPIRTGINLVPMPQKSEPPKPFPGPRPGSEAPQVPAEKGETKPTPVVRPPYTRLWEAEEIATFPAEAPGRDWELQALALELSRRGASGIVVGGSTKCGKTCLMQVFARKATAGTWKNLADTRFFQLDVPALMTNVLAGKVSHADFAETLNKLAQIQNAVLIVDPAHVFFGLGGPPGYHDLYAVMRGILLQKSLRLVFVTTPEFLKSVSVDLVFSALPQIQLGLLESPDIVRTVEQSCSLLEKTFNVIIPKAVVPRVVSLHEENGRKRILPYQAIRTLESACIVAVQNGDSKITVEHVAAAFARENRSIDAASPERLGHIEEELGKWVKGQIEAIRAVAPRIRMTRLQLDRNPNRPDGVFLFLGPSGVGKTELAKAITWALYGDLTRLVRVDMSEFMSQHEYSKLIGAPPGYIGHGEEGHLTGPVAKLGHGVILLDEIEKAHPSILKMFLQVFDEGFLTDGQGRRVDFSSFVIVMTSNMGRELYAEGKSRLGFLSEASKDETPDADAALQYLLKVLPSEFINRVDQAVPFKPLAREHLAEIARKLIDEEAARWLKRDRVLTFGEGIIDFLVDHGYDPRLGARHLARNFERTVSQTLSDAFCSQEWGKLQRLRLDITDGKPKLSPV
ncbi:MAG TPA: AAA family ATPase [Candidatus Ozemobacteraceae bacterium]|nr:AAA family ATPase [Candidatus Ozemobacteraceae bacterium]